MALPLLLLGRIGGGHRGRLLPPLAALAHLSAAGPQKTTHLVACSYFPAPSPPFGVPMRSFSWYSRSPPSPAAATEATDEDASTERESMCNSNCPSEMMLSARCWDCLILELGVGNTAQKSPLEGQKMMQRWPLGDSRMQTKLVSSDNGNVSENTTPNSMLESSRITEGNVSESSSPE